MRSLLKIVVLFLSIILSTFELSSQSCLVDGINFYSQQDVDDFPSNYPDCTSIEGFVYVNGSDITNLDSLSQLINIGGSLYISYNSLLSSIDGLENLQSIGEGLYIQGNEVLENLNAFSNITSINTELNLNYNLALTDISGLQNIDTISGKLSLNNNPIASLSDFSGLGYVNEIEIYYLPIIDFSGFENIDRLNGSVTIRGCPNLADFTGLNNIDSIFGYLFIDQNPIIENLSGFSSLAFIDGALKIGAGNNYSGNDSLQSLIGLETLTRVNGNVIVAGNDDLLSLEGLNNLQYVGGNFQLSEGYYGNGKLESTTALANLAFVGGDFVIIQASSLQEIVGLTSLDSIGGSIQIKINSNLSSISFPQLKFLGSGFDLVNNVILNSIDLNAELTQIGGLLHIDTNPRIRNLDFLSQVSSVGQDVSISYLDSILNISGLMGLSTIGEDLKIIGNANLESLDGLQNLNQLGGGLIFQDLPKVTSLSPLSGLSVINGILGLQGLDSLESFEGLASVDSIYGRLFVRENLRLKSLSGLDSLKYMESLFIYDNDSLNNISAIGNPSAANLTAITIKYNPMLTRCDIDMVCDYLAANVWSGYNISDNAEGCDSRAEIMDFCNQVHCLENGILFSSQLQIDTFALAYGDCNVIAGDVFIEGDDIQNLDGLTNLVAIEGSLTIGGYLGNPLLTDITGLSNIDYISGSLTIKGNDSLAVLAAYYWLDHIDGDLTFDNNPLLNNIHGLFYLDPDRIQNLTITNNPLLAICDIPSLCSYVSAPNGTIEIDNNAEGCNSQAELENACVTGPCQTYNVTFEFQHQVNNFRSEHPNCDVIDANVLITGSNITNLDSLSFLVGITGNLRISANNIRNLEGLDNLTYVGGNVEVYYANRLQNLVGLGSLVSIGGNFDIGEFKPPYQTGSNVDMGNDSLMTLEGLNNLESVGNVLRIKKNQLLSDISALSSLNQVDSSIAIMYSNLLTDLSGLESIRYLNNDLSISNNTSLLNFNGLNNLDSIGGDFELTMLPLTRYFTGLNNLSKIGGFFSMKNDSTISFQGLNSLERIEEFYVKSNSLQNFGGLENLNEIGSNFYVFSNSSLESLDGLNGLTQIGGSFLLGNPNQENPKLSSIEGLSGLTTIGDGLNISYTDSLSSFAGLENLVSIGGGSLSISRNTALIDISAIDDLVAPNLTYFYLRFNSQLAFCASPFICEILVNDDVSKSISNNALGCSSIFQIQQYCNDIPCLPNGIILSTQSEVDNFAINYPFCQNIGGSLHIEGNNISNLNGLSGIENIGGGLIIQNNPNLNTISGIENINVSSIDSLIIQNNPLLSECAYTSICGYLEYEPAIISISNNGLGCDNNDEILISCSAIPCFPDELLFTKQSEIDNFATNYPNCNNVEGNLKIYHSYDSDAITNLLGLSQLTYVGGNLSVILSPGLSSLEGLNNIEWIGGEFSVNNTSGIIDMTGMDQLDSIGGELRFYYNHTQVSFLGLENLHYIGDGITITDSESLISLEGLEGVTTINGDLYIRENDLLENISALENIEYSSIDNLTIGYNPSLSNCNAQSICDYVVDPTGNISIYANGSGCNNQEEVEFSCEVTYPCLTDGITFSNQSEIDDFRANYPSCGQILGDVIIAGDDITNLDSLISISQINGSLTIAHFLQNNPLLENLDGLANLSYIGGDLTIGEALYGNELLVNLGGLANLDSIGGFLQITSNTLLEDISSLSNLTAIGNNLTIEKNQALQSLVGLEGITEIQGELIIVENNSLVNLQGLNNLERVHYSFGLNGNLDLQNLDGLENLHFLDDDLFIVDHPILTDIQSLIGLHSIGGYLNITNNITIESLSGLDSIATIGGSLSIQQNWALLDLLPLSNVSNINGSLWILNNEQITGLEGLENIEESSILNIIFSGNANLSNCSIQNICEYLASPNGTVEILNNDTGCDSVDEVEEVCNQGPCLPEGIIFTTQAEVDNFEINNPLCVFIEGDVEISGNDITNLNALIILTGLGGNLSIQDNQNLTSLIGLSNLASINGDLFINNNESLTQLYGLSSIDPESISLLTITNNPLLSTCNVGSVCEFLITNEANAIINNNNTECNSISEVNTACLEGGCFPEGYTFLSQFDVDNFAIFYPNCNQIEGDVLISGADIVDLSPLSVLTAIGGHLFIENNTLLTNLEGLENIALVNGALRIKQNPVLSSLTGLEGLTNLGDYLKIQDNIALSNILGLNSLQEESLGDITIFANDVLAQCDIEAFCSYLSSPSGTVLIYDNNEGCNTIDEILAECLIFECGLDNLLFTSQDEVDHFPIDHPNCNYVLGDLKIEGNEISNIDSLYTITHVFGELWINNTGALVDLSGLDSMVFVGGRLNISYNEMLSNVDALSHIESVGGDLKIYNNSELTSITGLEGLTEIGDYLKIQFNPQLATLSGIDFIEESSISDLTIRDNEILSQCDVESVCMYLISPNGNVNIANNASGCADEEELSAICTPWSVEEIQSDLQFDIYPNPANDILYIKSNRNIDEIRIYSLQGQLKLVDNKSIIDLSTLTAGIYLIELHIDHSVYKKRLVIQ